MAGNDALGADALPSVFVLMPFDTVLQPVFDELIRPPLESAGFTVIRADSLLDQRNVLKDIVRGIRDAKLIIAEVTTPNPNVLYELGLAHGLRIPTMLIAQALDDVPFDLRSYRIEQYSTDFTRVDEFRERLRSIAIAHLRGELDFGSPMTDFYVEPGTGRPTDLLEDGSAHEPSPTPNEDSEGYFDHLLALEDATGAIEPYMDEIGSAVELLGARVQEHADAMSRVDHERDPGAPRQAYKIALRFANDLNQFASTLERQLPGFERENSKMITAGSGFLVWLTESSDADHGQLNQVEVDMDGLRESASSALADVREFRDSFESFRGASRDLDRAGRRAVSALDQLISEFEQVEAFATKVVTIVREAVVNDIAEVEEPEPEL